MPREETLAHLQMECRSSLRLPVVKHLLKGRPYRPKNLDLLTELVALPRLHELSLDLSRSRRRVRDENDEVGAMMDPCYAAKYALLSRITLGSALAGGSELCT